LAFNDKHVNIQKHTSAEALNNLLDVVVGVITESVRSESFQKPSEKSLPLRDTVISEPAKRPKNSKNVTATVNGFPAVVLRSKHSCKQVAARMVIVA
jgi:hypothetical protein